MLNSSSDIDVFRKYITDCPPVTMVSPFGWPADLGMSSQLYKTGIFSIPAQRPKMVQTF